MHEGTFPLSLLLLPPFLFWAFILFYFIYNNFCHKHRYRATLHHFLQRDVLEGLACNPHPLPVLQSLQIGNWFAYPFQLYQAASAKWT